VQPASTGFQSPATLPQPAIALNQLPSLKKETLKEKQKDEEVEMASESSDQEFRDWLVQNKFTSTNLPPDTLFDLRQQFDRLPKKSGSE
jgi:hypothetical protein